jgi:hypothetical protein
LRQIEIDFVRPIFEKFQPVGRWCMTGSKLVYVLSKRRKKSLEQSTISTDVLSQEGSGGCPLGCCNKDTFVVEDQRFVKTFSIDKKFCHVTAMTPFQ